MNKIKDKKIIVLVAILMIFTISYFAIINKISYSFVTDYNVKDTYNDLIDTIKQCAKTYALKNKDIFKEDKIAYIKVQDLIDNNLLVPNDGGNVVSPLDKKTILNSNIIKIKKDGDDITIEVDS